MNNLNIYSGMVRSGSAVIEKFIQPLLRVHGSKSALFLQCVRKKKFIFKKLTSSAPPRCTDSEATVSVLNLAG
jgi:hypothetical protein